MKKYSNPYEAIDDSCAVILEILTEDERDYLRSVLDFESTELHVHDGLVDIVDVISGEVYNTLPFFEFVRNSVQFAMHDCADDERRDMHS